MEFANFIRIRSYGFLHPGRERWKRVLKKSWAFIPGSTLYGAVSFALLRSECQILDSLDSPCVAASDNCGYHQLLSLVKNRRIRFSPLLASGTEIKDFSAYNKAGQQILSGKGAHYATTPHAPVDRRTGKIFEDQLYGVSCHQPFQDYYGFVLCEDDNFVSKIKKALRMLPIMPFGGRGKYQCVEGEVIAENRPVDELKKALSYTMSCSTRALTPVIVPKDSFIDMLRYVRIMDFRLQKYRVWRTGLYWENGEWMNYESAGDHSRRQSPPGLGLAEGTRIVFQDHISKECIQDLFAKGMGDKDWTYLGWGQIICEEGRSDHEDSM